MTARKLLVFVFVLSIAALAMENRASGQPSVCPAWLECPSAGCRIYCYGSYCVNDMTYIICDGVTTNCPWNGICNPPSDCLEPCGYCECVAQSGQSSFYCRRNYCRAPIDPVEPQP